jgi:dihydroneopterin aldolase
MDSINLQDIRVSTHIGVSKDERAVPQDLLVSVWMETSISATAKADSLKHGIDYAEVTHAVIEIGSTERKTVERFAEDIAQMLLRRFKPERVSVSVEKHPPLPIQAARITITRP